MKFWIGKLLQLAGIGVVPWALIRGESGAHGALTEELYFLGLAVAVFGMGWLVERL